LPGTSAEVMPPIGGSARASRQRLLTLVNMHVRYAHPEMAKTPPPPEALEKLIREV
jgi:hypothetical protein